MSTLTSIQTDSRVRTAVEQELDWTPEVDSAGIGVAVEDGTVTLSGEVDTYAERVAATKAAQRVRGVDAVVDKLVVHPTTSFIVTETDIAKDVEHALRASTNIPDTVKATIHAHAVTLTGEVDWDFQRRAAREAVQYLRGVESVDSRITLRARPSATDTKERILGALRRQAILDAQGIHVTVSGDAVTLTGTVHSWAEKQQAGRAAWGSPHVARVDNRLRVI